MPSVDCQSSRIVCAMLAESWMVNQRKTAGVFQHGVARNTRLVFGRFGMWAFMSKVREYGKQRWACVGKSTKMTHHLWDLCIQTASSCKPNKTPRTKTQKAKTTFPHLATKERWESLRDIKIEAPSPNSKPSTPSQPFIACWQCTLP